MEWLGLCGLSGGGGRGVVEVFSSVVDAMTLFFLSERAGWSSEVGKIHYLFLDGWEEELK